MNISQVSRLKVLEEENYNLKQMYADWALDNKIFKDGIEKNIEFFPRKKIALEIVVE